MRMLFQWFVCVLAVVSSVSISVGQEHRIAPLQEIVLAGDIAKAESQISGMAWWRNTLVLLPQYTDWRRGKSVLYTIPEKTIRAYLDTETPMPITPEELPIVVPKSISAHAGFEGLEAILIIQDRVYVTVEISHNGLMQAYLVTGTIAKTGVTLTDTRIPLPAPLQIPNMAFESLSAYQNDVIAFFEVNSPRLPVQSVAYLCEKGIAPCVPLPLESVMFRITDATRSNSRRQLWILNQSFKAIEKKLQSTMETDPCSTLLGNTKGYGQLMPFQLTTEDIRRDTSRPVLCIQMQHVDKRIPNFEGLVRLDRKGFLVITDAYPRTLFGFVEYGDVLQQ